MYNQFFEERREKIQLAWKQWVYELNHDFFITINFHLKTPEPYSLEKAKHKIIRFKTDSEKFFLGKYYSRKPEFLRMVGIGMPEKIDSNLHYHFLINFPHDGFKEVAEIFWKKLVPSGSIHFEKIHSDADRRRVASYSSKETYKFANYNNAILLGGKSRNNKN